MLRLDPANPSETGDEMGALEGDAVELEIGEAGIGLGRGMAGEEAGKQPLVADRSRLADQARPRAGERVCKTGGAVDEQGKPRIAGEVAAVLGQVGKKQQRST